MGHAGGGFKRKALAERQELKAEADMPEVALSRDARAMPADQLETINRAFTGSPEELPASPPGSGGPARGRCPYLRPRVTYRDPEAAAARRAVHHCASLHLYLEGSHHPQTATGAEAGKPTPAE
jgi:hypothetical protein